MLLRLRIEGHRCPLSVKQLDYEERGEPRQFANRLMGTMITNISFHRFKQFQDASLALKSGLTLIAGGNNAGKSTILHGIAVWEFCRTAFEMEQKSDAFNAGYQGQGLGLGDDEFSPIALPSLRHLWSNLKTQKDGEPDGYTLKLKCEWDASGSARHLEFALALSNDRLFVKPVSSDLGSGDQIPRAAYLPPFAGITDRESRTSGALRRRRIGEGLAGAVLRSILLDMYERNLSERANFQGSRSKISRADLRTLRNSDPWELLQQYLRKTFGAELIVKPFREEYHSYIQVEIVKGTVDGYKLRRHAGYNKRDLMVEGSGFLQWLSVFALANDPDIDILLLDEPDAHLHPSLQEQLLDVLQEIAERSQKQILVATHSSEILRSAEPSNIIQVKNRGGRYMVEEHQKVAMLAGIGSEYSPRIDKAKRTKRILFVEGRSDLLILKVLAGKLNIDWPPSWTEWITSTGQKERKQISRALTEEVPDLRVLSLRDRDDEAFEMVGSDLVDGSTPPADIDFHARRWRRRYIESYLIWPAAIAAATGLSEDQVNQALTEHHGIAVGDNFTDTNAPQGLLDVRGKEVLKTLDAPAVMGQFDVTALKVAKNMHADAIPDDIKVLLNEVTSLA